MSSSHHHQELQHHQESQHHQEPWIDRWFPLLVILFGILFVSILVSFKPHA